MKKTLLILLIIIFTAPIILDAKKPKYKIAFGYFANLSKDRSLDYLEKIFPNTFTNTLRLKFDANVIKPFKINKILLKKNTQLKKQYPLYKVPALVKLIGADCFIFGSFTSLTNNKIRVSIHVYKKNALDIFTFVTIGKLETEIFNLVDNISLLIVGYLSKKPYFKYKQIIAPKKLSILTNLSGYNHNYLIYSFMKSGFKVSSLGSNELYQSHSITFINKLFHLSTKNNSFDLITDKRKMVFLFGTWMSSLYVKKVKNYKRIITQYDFNFIQQKNKILNKIKNNFDSDYVLVIGFNNSKTRAWIRVVDLKSKNLVSLHNNISGRNVYIISEKIISFLKTPIAKK